MAIHKGINPPVPKQLVGKSHIPPGLSPAHTGSSENMPRIRLAGEFRKAGTGIKAGLRPCRLPVRRIPVRHRGWLVPTDTGLLAEPSGQNTRNTI